MRILPDHEDSVSFLVMDGDNPDPWNLRSALGGDVDAWTAIVHEFSSTIWGWARNQGLGREDAEDVCQSVWYLLKDRGHSIEDPRRLAGWLATTTRREAQAVSIRGKRSRSDLGSEGLDRQIADPTPGPEDRAVATEAQQRLREAFDSLKQKCRELLSLLWADVAYRDIAEMLSMAVGSIGETRRRCLADLRREAQLA